MRQGGWKGWGAGRAVGWLLAVLLALGPAVTAPCLQLGPIPPGGGVFADAAICHSGDPAAPPGQSQSDHDCCGHCCCMGSAAVLPQVVRAGIPWRVAVAAPPAPLPEIRRVAAAPAAHRPRAPPVAA